MVLKKSLSVLVSSLASELAQKLGNKKVYTSFADRLACSRDWSVQYESDYRLPDIVVRPQTTQDIVETVRVAESHDTAIIPVGGMTGLGGGIIPSSGGIAVDMKGMNRVLEFDRKNLVVTVEAGITIDELNQFLAKTGHWFPIITTSRKAATIGAVIALRSDSSVGIKYGKIEDLLVGVKMIIGNGRAVKLGHSKTLISSSGYQLHWLAIASEGTLGIITEATLKVFPVPRYRALHLSSFRNAQTAVDALNEILKDGVCPESAHILDRGRLIWSVTGGALDTKNLVFPEGAFFLDLALAGERMLTDASLKLINRTVMKFGGSIVRDKNIIDAVWNVKFWNRFRPFDQKWPSDHLAHGKRFAAADVSIPEGELDTAYSEFELLSRKHGLKSLGGLTYIQKPHSVHTSISFAVYVNDRSKAEVDHFRKFVREMAQMANRLGGSISSYQGDAEKFGKEFLMEHGESLELMLAIKRLFDPKDVFNRGKKLPPAKAVE